MTFSPPQFVTKRRQPPTRVMTIAEFAILVFKSPPNFSDPTLRSLFQRLSAWQSECSEFPLLFFTNPDDSRQIHLVTGWASVTAHEAWIRGERNQELLCVFAPYVDMQKIRMVHVDVDFEAIPKDVEEMVIERYGGEEAVRKSFLSERSDRCCSTWSLIGRDLARDDNGGDMFRFVGVAGGDGESEFGGVLASFERWVLKRVEV